MAVRGRGGFIGSRPPPTPQNIPTNKLAQAKRGFITVTKGGVPTVIQSQSKRPPKPSPTKTNGGLFGGFFEGFFGTPTVTTPAPKAPTPTPQVSTPAPSVTYTPVGQVAMQGGGRGQPKPPTSQKTFCMVVYGQQMQLTGDAINWYIDNGVDVRPCGEKTTTSNGNLEARVARLEQYPQAVGTASQKSDQDIWDHLDEHVWSNPPYNNPNAINVKLDKAIAEHGVFDTKLQSLGDALQSAYEHRTGIEQKVDVGIAEHQDFHTKLQGLGDSLVEAKEHRDSLEKKLEIQRKHTHGKSPDDEEDCGWFGEKCWIKGLPDLSWLKWVLLAVGSGILLWLLRPIFNLIGIFKGGSV